MICSSPPRLAFFVLLVNLLGWGLPAAAQGEFDNWYFGQKAGVAFTPGSAQAVTDGQLVSGESSAAISSRTRDALAAKKARGTVLGTPANLTPAARAKGLVARQGNAQANVNHRQAAQLATLLKANGATLRAIAEQLNQFGYCTRRGKAFNPLGVQRLLAKRP